MATRRKISSVLLIAVGKRISILRTYITAYVQSLEPADAIHMRTASLFVTGHMIFSQQKMLGKMALNSGREDCHETQERHIARRTRYAAPMSNPCIFQIVLSSPSPPPEICDIDPLVMKKAPAIAERPSNVLAIVRTVKLLTKIIIWVEKTCKIAYTSRL